MDQNHITIKLTIVRHGQTHDNISHVISGHRPVGLTEVGVKQAQCIGKYFHQQQTQFDQIYVSDLQRTKQTFQAAVSEVPHLQEKPVVYTAVLRERGAGILETEPLTIWAENAVKQNKGVRQYKCQGAESWQDVMARSAKFLEMIIRAHAIENKERKEVKLLAVSHGGYIMELHNTCSRLQGGVANLQNTAKNCSMHTFEIQYPEEQDYSESHIKIKCTDKNFVGHLSL